jgi:hypothetical protein
MGNGDTAVNTMGCACHSGWSVARHVCDAEDVGDVYRATVCLYFDRVARVSSTPVGYADFDGLFRVGCRCSGNEAGKEGNGSKVEELHLGVWQRDMCRWCDGEMGYIREGRC